MTIDDDLWDMMNPSSLRKSIKQPGSLIFNVTLPKKRPKSKIHIHGLNNESEDFLDLIGRSTKKKRVEDEAQEELKKKKDRPLLGKKIDLMSMSSLLSSQESQLKSQSEALKKLDRAGSQTSSGELGNNRIAFEEETTGQGVVEVDIKMGTVTEDKSSKDIPDSSSEDGAVGVRTYSSQKLILADTLNSEKNVIIEKNTDNNTEESEEGDEEEVNEAIPQIVVDREHNAGYDMDEEEPGRIKSLSPDLIDDSEDEPDIIIPSIEVMEQLLSQIRQSHDAVVPSQTTDNSDNSVTTKSDIQGVSEEVTTRTAVDSTDLVQSTTAELPTVNISPDLNKKNKRPSKVSSPIKTTKALNSKRAKVSLASLCSKTNNSQTSHRVGLSKRLRVDSLHNYLAK